MGDLDVDLVNLNAGGKEVCLAAAAAADDDDDVGKFVCVGVVAGTKEGDRDRER